jgi:methylglutaconyl-CoA hydratase
VVDDLMTERASAAEEVLKIDRQGAVVRIALNRPARRNALSRALVGALLDQVTALANDANARVIVLSGEGAAFCAGGDIAEYAESAASGRAPQDAEALASLLAAMADCPLPVVARVHGTVYGGGFGLACACDIAICSDDATFSLSEARLGLIPAVISPYVFTSLGEREAKARMLLAAPFDAQEALRIGLVHRVTTADDLDAAVDEAIANLLRCAPGALAGVKRLPTLLRSPDRAVVRDATAALLAERLGSDEAQEGLRAFLEKRAPSWTSRG